MTTKIIVPMERSEMIAINGGGFAYDVGRILRFLYISGGGSSAYHTALAITDWQVNEAINQQN